MTTPPTHLINLKVISLILIIYMWCMCVGCEGGYACECLSLWRANVSDPPDSVIRNKLGYSARAVCDLSY